MAHSEFRFGLRGRSSRSQAAKSGSIAKLDVSSRGVRVSGRSHTLTSSQVRLWYPQPRECSTRMDSRTSAPTRARPDVADDAHGSAVPQAALADGLHRVNEQFPDLRVRAEGDMGRWPGQAGPELLLPNCAEPLSLPRVWPHIVLDGAGLRTPCIPEG
jgi:hypothetical protein